MTTGAGDGMMMMSPPPPAMPMSPGSGGDDMGMGMGMGKGKMMMHMTFFWGHRVEILFSGWPGDRGVGMYLLALLAVFVASVLVEAFTYVPHSMVMRAHGPTPVSKPKGLMLTGLAALRTGLSYLVMLAVMSFNVGVLIVAIAGHAVGFFLFGCGVFKWSPGVDGVQADAHQAAALPQKC